MRFFQVYGKIENMKIIKKESKAHVKYISFEIAEKVVFFYKMLNFYIIL